MRKENNAINTRIMQPITRTDDDLASLRRSVEACAYQLFVHPMLDATIQAAEKSQYQWIASCFEQNLCSAVAERSTMMLSRFRHSGEKRFDSVFVSLAA